MYEAVKCLCEENNISINQLEEKLSIPRGSIYKWDKNAPSVYRVKRVADYFGKSVDELIKES